MGFADRLIADLGDRAPRIACVPPAVDYSLGEAVIAIGELAGIHLDPWQRMIVLLVFARRADGKWAAFEVVLVLPRQNGKNAVLEVIQLGKLIVVRDGLQVHTAHLGETSDEAFGRLKGLIEECPELDERVAHHGFHKTNGKAGITLSDGCRMKFRTRTNGGGRGLTGDTVYGDEAFNFQESTHGSLFPTMSARSITGNPQMIYASSAVDQTMPGHEHGIVLARLRERAVAAAGDPELAAIERLLYLEWSVCEVEFAANPEIAGDPKYWLQANPALDVRISREHVASERKSMSPRTFATERLGVGDWPATSGVEQVIPAEWWEGQADEQSQIAGRVDFVFDVRPDQKAASISVSGFREDGKLHYEVIDHEPGTDWLAQRVKDRLAKSRAKDIGCQETGPAGAHIKALEALGIKVVPIKPAESAQACGMFFNSMKDGTGFHRNQPVLNDAIKGAARQRQGDEAWTWSRKSSDVDISGLIGVTLAGWRASGRRRSRKPMVARGS